MQFKKFTVKKMLELSKSKKFSYLFDNIELSRYKDDRDLDELVEKIAVMFMHEFEIDSGNLSKVTFFLKLVGWSKK